jgi:hypothetical protein
MADGFQHCGNDGGAADHRVVLAVAMTAGSGAIADVDISPLLN